MPVGGGEGVDELVFLGAGFGGAFDVVGAVAGPPPVRLRR
jgi:hypothetical protein